MLRFMIKGVGYRVKGQGVAALYGVVWKVNGIGCWV